MHKANAAVLSGAGVVTAVYLTYRYIKNKNKSHPKQEDSSASSSSGSFYTTPDYLSDSEYSSAQEECITEQDLLYEKVDILMNGDKSGIENAYSMMKEFSTHMSEYPNFLWRYAKVHHLKGKVEKSEARTLNIKGLEYAEKAVRMDPENSEAHKWFAILKGREAEFLNDVRKKVDNAKIFFEHIQKALKLKPNDWELHHLLGVFEFKLADVNPFVKAFACSAFKGISQCNYGVARNHFNTAEKHNPESSKETKLFLAKCFYAEKEFEKALKCLIEALEMKVKSVDDKACHEEAKELKYVYMKAV